MDDLISRQAAIDAVHLSYDKILDFKSTGRTVADSIEDIINALPPAQQLIPCSERLPSYFEDVLLAFGRNFNVGYLISTNDETEREWFCSGWYFPMSEVDAWMPLPKPYEREEK